MVFHDHDYILVHAGIHPKIDFNTLICLVNAIGNHLQSNTYAFFIHKIFGNKPNYWTNELGMMQKMKFVINSCTRMRFLKTDDYSLDYKYKGDLKTIPSELIPWFKVDFDSSINKKIIFGHWAALGLCQTEKIIALDTGCVWGNKLTAVNLENMQVFQV